MVGTSILMDRLGLGSLDLEGNFRVLGRLELEGLDLGFGDFILGLVQ